MKKNLCVGILFLILVTFGFGQVNLKDDFAAGDIILASDMNNNFTTIETNLNNLLGMEHWQPETGGIHHSGGVGIGSLPAAGVEALLHMGLPSAAADEEPFAIFRASTGRTMQLLQPDPTDVQSPFTWYNVNAFSWRVDDIDAMILTDVGDLGIGTMTPDGKVEICRTDSITDLRDTGELVISDTSPQIDLVTSDAGHADWAIQAWGDRLYFIDGDEGDDWDADNLVLRDDGVGINSSPISPYALAVNGGGIRIDDNYAHDFGDAHRTVKYFSAGMTMQSPGAIYMMLDNNNNQTSARFSVTRDSNDPATDVELFTVLETGKVGIGTSSPSYDLHVNGSAYCTTSWATSDIRYKENITPISSALGKLKNISGVNFTWKSQGETNNKFPEGGQIGLIAQEVEKEFPQLVNTADDGYKAVDYGKFTAVLLQAVKEQQTEIDELKEQIQVLKEAVGLE